MRTYTQLHTEAFDVLLVIHSAAGVEYAHSPDACPIRYSSLWFHVVEDGFPLS